MRDHLQHRRLPAALVAHDDHPRQLICRIVTAIEIRQLVQHLAVHVDQASLHLPHRQFPPLFQQQVLLAQLFVLFLETFELALVLYLGLDDLVLEGVEPRLGVFSRTLVTVRLGEGTGVDDGAVLKVQFCFCWGVTWG